MLLKSLYEIKARTEFIAPEKPSAGFALQNES